MTSLQELSLRHYDDSVVLFDREWTYPQAERIGTHTKPRGFWVSVLGEDDWPTWCAAESFDSVGLTVEHAVTLSPDANVLLIPTPQLLDAFTKTYGISEEKAYGGHSWTDTSIDWHRVAREYDGIVIAPYQWERRLGLDWYYGWDVASGCIWNASAVVDVAPIAAEAVPA